MADDRDVTETIYADGVAMVQLLGPQDRLLRVVEREHRDVQVHVRGNEITLSGAADAVARARALVEELIALSRTALEHDAGEGKSCGPTAIMPFVEIGYIAHHCPQQWYGRCISQTLE